MTIINKKWKKGVNIKRVNLLKYKKIIPTGRLPIIHTYHPSVKNANETIVEELQNYS